MKNLYQALHDAGINPFAVTLLIESYAAARELAGDDGFPLHFIIHEAKTGHNVGVALWLESDAVTDDVRDALKTADSNEVADSE